MKILLSLTFVILLLCDIVEAKVIHVPADQLTIQAGIDAAVIGDTVLVQPGKYVGHIVFNGKAIVVGSLFLTTRDTSYISQTVIDGDTSGRVVFFISGEEKTSILCGFTIQNGLGGIFCVNSSPTITYCTISNNSTIDTLENGKGTGGGIYCQTASPTISYCVIDGNTAFGVFAMGGGIYCSLFSSPEITHCIISNNSSVTSTNWATTGGGIFSRESSPVVRNCLITNNKSSTRGAGINCLNSFAQLINCTVTENINNLYNAVVSVEGTSLTSTRIANCIIYGNTGRDVATGDVFSSINCSYSDIGSGYSGGTNISSDPLFIGNGDYSLQAASPCIDAGDNSVVGWNSDLNGNQRFWDGDGDGSAIVDMGAYEYDSIAPEYDLEFIPLADMNFERYGAGYTSDGNNLYSICGGISESPGISNAVERYNIANDTWIEFVTGIIPRVYCSTEYVSSQNKIYIFNGVAYTSSTYTDTVEIIDVSTGNLSYSATNPYPVEYGGSAVWNDKIYLFGGSNSNGYSNRLYEFDILTNAWTRLPDMPEAKQTNGEIINGVLYVFGGYNGSVSKRIDAYNIQNSSWTFLGEMPVGISAHATAESGKNVWIVGSYDNIRFLAVYNTAANDFSQLSSNMIGRRHSGAVVEGNNLYIFGGNQASTDASILKSLEYTDISDYIVSIADAEIIIPANFYLCQNFPNPFNPVTTIKFSIPGAHFVTLKVFDMLGREIETLVNEEKSTGNYELKFDCSNLSSGIYFYRLQAGNFSGTKKLIFLK